MVPSETRGRDLGFGTGPPRHWDVEGAGVGACPRRLGHEEKQEAGLAPTVDGSRPAARSGHHFHEITHISDQLSEALKA